MTTDKNITTWIKHLPFRASKTALGTKLYLNAQKTEFIFPSLSADMKGTNGMVVKQENNFRILPLSKPMHQYRCQFAGQCWRIKNELFAQKILQKIFTTKLGNPVKFQRFKKLWYLLLQTFWLLLPKFNFCKRNIKRQLVWQLLYQFFYKDIILSFTRLSFRSLLNQAL